MATRENTGSRIERQGTLMKALEGIRIIDLTYGHGGSLAAMTLADHGAEVIKIEPPAGGDRARNWAPLKNGGSGYFAYLNRGKKSVAMDLDQPEGQEVLKELVKTADVLLENQPYGRMEDIGLSYEEAKKVKPDIIYASVTPYGRTGPRRARKGIELTMQASGGLMSRTGFTDGDSVKAGPEMAHQAAGLYAANAVVMALIVREKTGEGQRIDVALNDAIYSLMEGNPITYAMEGKIGPKLGNGDPTAAPYDTFETNDGFVALGTSSDPQWEKTCDALGMDELKAREEYKKNADRVRIYFSGPKMREEVTSYTSKLSKFECEQRMWALNQPCGAVYSISEAMESEQVKARGMLAKVHDDNIGEEIEIPGVVIRFSETPGAIESGAPLLGQDTEAVLAATGYSKEKISELEEKGIIRAAAQGDSSGNGKEVL